MNQETISIKQYLTQKDIPFKEQNSELIVKCLFADCDKDSRPNEAHLYFNVDTGQYHCKKCGTHGNIHTLVQHLNDQAPFLKPAFRSRLQTKRVIKSGFDPNTVTMCQNAIPERIRAYLHARGITDALIDRYKLGWGEFYGKWWITIPIQDHDGNYMFLKLRHDPECQDKGSKYSCFPAGNSSTLYGWDTLKDTEEIMICEGEFDSMILSSIGVPAITFTAGAGTMKEEWTEHLKHLKKVYVCYDKDDAGEKGSEKLIQLLDKQIPNVAIFKTTLPDRMTDGKDITDYITRYKGNPDELIYECSKQVAGKNPIDISKFKELDSQDIIDVLGLTIKKDEANKLTTFLCALSAYTEQSQINISFNAPSSTGKSFIPTEIANLFPSTDVMLIGNCSPTAFFHEQGVYDKEKNTTTIDLSRKIMVFLDQPHPGLLEKLRSLLSHDQKEMISKITDKSQKGGNKTKTVILRGYPAVIFCSAGLKIDEQESTRFILLSPQTSQEKLRDSIHEKILKSSNNEAYAEALNANPERQLLKERIEAIKDENIDEIQIANPELIEKVFLSNKNKLKPRHQRDVGRLMSLTKSFALLNVWFRERKGSTIVATVEDFQKAIELWNQIGRSQEYNVPPYILDLYNDVIVTAYHEKNTHCTNNCKTGITRTEIRKKHHEVYARMAPDWQLRQDIIPMLETAGLISQEPDVIDKRKMLITPLVLTEHIPETDIVSSTGE